MRFFGRRRLPHFIQGVRVALALLGAVMDTEEIKDQAAVFQARRADKLAEFGEQPLFRTELGPVDGEDSRERTGNVAVLGKI